jgi:hypothetical protein
MKRKNKQVQINVIDVRRLFPSLTNISIDKNG